jgi:AmmeMemoRadiSam system protein B/AmmeMemoRadiSam system protein A
LLRGAFSLAVVLAAASCGDKRNGAATLVEPGVTSDTAEERTRALGKEPLRIQGAFPSQVAGRFYPGDPEALAIAVDKYVDSARSPKQLASRDVVGILAPHAGYEYSGVTAGFAYKVVAGKPYSTVVILASSHRRAASRLGLLSAPAYDTPLGSVPIDQAVVQSLVKEHPDVFALDDSLFSSEHSLEVQLPFIQRVLPDARIVPIIAASQDQAVLSRAGKALFSKLGKRRDVLFVVSSDMSHFYPDAEAKRYDNELLGYLERWDIPRWAEMAPRQPRGMCGARPMQVVVAWMEGFAADRRKVTRLDYRTSGDTAGDPSRVVGYAALAFSVEENMREPGQHTDFGPFDLEARRALMDIAKKAVSAAVKGERYMPEKPPVGLLLDDGAAFVTLKKNGQLRGCIGHVVARMPLFLCVSEVGKAAAIYDSRFNPVQPEELSELTLEVSVLTPPVQTTPEQVVVGRDGLIISASGRSGLLLPQVPVEWGWNREQFLDHTCNKAGLPPGCWREPGTRLESFRAIVWSEEDTR